MAPSSNTDENRTLAVAPSSECKGKCNAAAVPPPGECNTNQNLASRIRYQNEMEDRGNMLGESMGTGKEGNGETWDRGSREMKSAQYQRLWDVDPEMASRIHPSNKRKIAR